MSVVIRLARAGTKKRPVYHVVVADSRFPRDGRFIERLGHFNPLLAKDNEARLKLDLDKVKTWLAKAAQEELDCFVARAPRHDGARFPPTSPRHCERSEAIQKAARKALDCFVASAPRNDGERSPLSSPRHGVLLAVTHTAVG